MSEQLWGIGGVVAGIAVTTAGKWWADRSKHNREHATEVRKENRKRCEELLFTIDGDIGGVDHYHDEHGVFPVDNDEGPVETRGRDMLTEIQLNCPPRIHAAAVSLVDAFEAWAAGGGAKGDLDARRTRFIGLVRKLL